MHTTIKTVNLLHFFGQKIIAALNYLLIFIITVNYIADNRELTALLNISNVIYICSVQSRRAGPIGNG